MKIALLDGSSLSDIQDNDGIELSDQLPADFPEKIFGHFDILKDFCGNKNCRKSGAVVKLRILAKATGEVFTAYFTNEDACDGGNAYGFIVHGEEAILKSVVFLIRDGDFERALT